MFNLPEDIKNAHRSENSHIRIEMWHEGECCNGLNCLQGKCDIITINKMSSSTVKVIYTDYHTKNPSGYITYKQLLDKSMLVSYLRTLAYMIGNDSLDQFQYIQYNFPLFPCIVLNSRKLTSVNTRRHLENMATLVYAKWFEEQGIQEEPKEEPKEGQEASYTFPNFFI
jgi:hypothetical protein